MKQHSISREATLMRRLRTKRIAAGLCARCGKTRPRPNVKTCTRCANKARIIHERTRQRRMRREEAA